VRAGGAVLSGWDSRRAGDGWRELADPLLPPGSTLGWDGTRWVPAARKAASRLGRDANPGKSLHPGDASARGSHDSEELLGHFLRL
jgi:hypothetical protein